MARLLFAEDDPHQARILLRWLQSAGHEVVHVADGLQGFRDATLGGAPDLLVTDLMMPDVDGEELAGAVDLIRPGLPVLVVTAAEDGALLRRMREAPGVRAVLHKPVDRATLLQAVEDAVGAA